jgi:hypothetical protein
VGVVVPTVKSCLEDLVIASRGAPRADGILVPVDLVKNVVDVCV